MVFPEGPEGPELGLPGGPDGGPPPRAPRGPRAARSAFRSSRHARSARAPGPKGRRGPQKASRNFPGIFPERTWRAAKCRVTDGGFWSRRPSVPNDAVVQTHRTGRAETRKVSKPKCAISMCRNVGPKRGPRDGRGTRPEPRFDPAGSHGSPCTTGPGVSKGHPKRRRKTFEIGVSGAPK